jgi:hypothetical protein
MLCCAVYFVVLCTHLPVRGEKRNSICAHFCGPGAHCGPKAHNTNSGIGTCRPLLHGFVFFASYFLVGFNSIRGVHRSHYGWSHSVV